MNMLWKKKSCPECIDCEAVHDCTDDFMRDEHEEKSYFCGVCGSRIGEDRTCPACNANV